MDAKAKAAAVKEWAEVRKNYPEFARAFVAQQLILIDASESGDEAVARQMRQMVSAGMVVPFFQYWETLNQQTNPGAQPLKGALACLIKNHGDPSKCFSIDPSGWFDYEPKKWVRPGPDPRPLDSSNRPK